MANSQPLSNRIPLPNPTPPAPGGADPTDSFFALMARSLNGGNLAVPSGRTQLFKQGWINSVAQGASGRLQGASRRLPRSRSTPLNWAGYLVLLGVGVYFGTQALLAAAAWTGDHWTTLQYGDPRTTHLSAAFGFAGETPLAPTTITAVTAPGVAHLFVLPGDRADKAFVLDLPLPADPDGRQPMHLSSEDVDRDGHPDLLVQPGAGLIYPYLLDTGKQTFRPPPLFFSGRRALGRGR